MSNLLTINHPFRTVEDFRRTAGWRLASRIHRLARKYPHPAGGRASKRMLLALSVAWALTALAKAGDNAAFEHIDEALSPCSLHGCVCMPQGGCVVVEGVPFYIAEGEQAVLHFLWDGFTIFIDHEGTACVEQHFFDFADARQSKAYSAMGEDAAQSADLPSAPAPSVPHRESIPAPHRESIPAPHRESIPAPHRASPLPLPKPTACEAPTPQPQQESTAEPNGRPYLAEMVQSVVAYGSEQDIRNLLASFGYLPHHDSHTDHLRGILLQKLKERAMQQAASAGNHYNFTGSVGQFVARGNGYMDVQGNDTENKTTT